MKQAKMRKRGIVYVCLTAICWGVIGLFTRTLQEAGLSSISITWIRCLGCSSLLGLYLLLFERNRFQVKVKDIWIFIGSGVIGNAFFNYCYFETIRQASLAEAAVLLYTAPCFVVLFSAPLFRERLTVKKGVAVLVAFLGCALCSGFTLTGMHMSLPVLLTGIGSGLGYALYSVFLKIAAEKGYASSTTAFYTYLFCLLSLSPFTDMWSTITLSVSQVSILLAAISITVLCTLIPAVLYAKAMTLLDAGVCALFSYVEPLTAAGIGALIFHEAITLEMIIGMILILGGLAILHLPHARSSI